MLLKTMVPAACAVAGIACAGAPPSPDDLPLRANAPGAAPTETLPQSPTLVAGDWTMVANNSSVVVFEKPATPALGPDGFRRIEVRFEFATPQTVNNSKAYQSMLVLTEFDCARSRTRNVQATAFAGHNLGLPLGPPQQDPGDWQPVEDGSVASILMKDACPSSP